MAGRAECGFVLNIKAAMVAQFFSCYGTLNNSVVDQARKSRPIISTSVGDRKEIAKE
jgi:hypothetical protein